MHWRKRVAQLLLVFGLYFGVTQVTLKADEATCMAMCDWMESICVGNGDIWQCDCDFPWGYYDYDHDICDLDAFCWHIR
jgi:hypothetical protein